MKTKSSYKYLFLGLLVKENEFDTILKLDKHPQIQTLNFLWKLFNGLKKNSDASSFFIISSRPVNRYPIYKKIIIKREIKKWIYPIIEIPYINLIYLHIITRFISSLCETFKWFIQHRHTCLSGIIVHSIHFPFMLTGFIMSRMFKVPLIALWTDPPGVVLKNDNIVIAISKKIEFFLAKKIMKKYNGVICFSKHIAIDFAPQRPHLVIEGLVGKVDLEKKGINEFPPSYKKNEKNKFKILYAGTLNLNYRFDVFLKAFSALEYQDVVLEILGTGDAESQVRSFAEKDRRIHYLGFKKNEEVLLFEKSANLLVNPRPVDLWNTKYSFPSKIIEYMMSGTPVVSTRLLGIPDEYDQYLYYFDSFNEDQLRLKFQEIYLMNRQELKNFGLRAQHFVLTNKGEVQVQRIVDFIDKIKY